MSDNKVKEDVKVEGETAVVPTAASEAPKAPKAADNSGVEAAQTMATAMGEAMASAIRESSASEKNWVIKADSNINSRFTVVRDKATGEVMLRENANGHLSKIQLKSLEEKDADIQGAEVEEV